MAEERSSATPWGAPDGAGAFVRKVDWSSSAPVPVDAVESYGEPGPEPKPDLGYGAPEEHPAPAGDDAGLSDLFGDDAPAEAPTDAPDVAETDVAETDVADTEDAAPDVAEPIDDLTDLFGDDAPADEPAPAAAPEVPPATEAAAPKGRFDLAERRRQAEAASMGSDDTDLVQAAMNTRQAERYRSMERLYGTVDRILGLIAADPEIQRQVNSFVLSRDKAVDVGQRRLLQEVVGPRMIGAAINIANPAEVSAIFDMAYDEFIGIGPLGELWRDDDITEIMVDAWDQVSVERNGHLLPTAVRFRDAQHARSLARSLAQKVSDRALSPTSPLVTAELDGARVTFCYGAVVKSGLSITMRKFRPLLGIEGLMGVGALDAEMLAFLDDCVRARATVLVSGGTGTGKTTMINALSQFIPATERVITIEDSFELKLTNAHVVSLSTKEKASADDEVNITQADLLVNTLRMRPDRIIVGEIREGAGARVMLQAANTGHDGTMTTIHANTASAALNDRLSNLLREATQVPDDVARRSVASAINLVVQVTRRHNRRFISEIAVVDSSSMRNGLVAAEPVFTGEVVREDPTDPTSAIRTVFRRSGGVRPDTELGMKLADAGIDPSRWEPVA